MSPNGPTELAIERPSNVPANAGWFFVSQEWLCCERDANGELHGPFRSYRVDGRPWAEFEYRHGKRHGPFRLFYESGRLAQEGRYFDDLLDGLLLMRSDGANAYSIRECCIRAEARTMKQEHRRGHLLAETFEDEQGQRLDDADGAPGAPGWPEPLREREGDVLSFPYDFWPARQPLPLPRDDQHASVEQSLSTMREAIQRAAQRVLACRRWLLECGETSVPPDISGVFSGSALPLRRFTFEAESDDEPITVHVDETPTRPRSNRDLTLRARLEWTSLCWLCWAVGLDRIGLPERVEPRLNLYPALEFASERQAALTGHDLKPSSASHFHGMNETLLPASALSHLADHYREIRAVLLFASDPECRSPWQDDLGREPDPPEI